MSDKTFTPGPWIVMPEESENSYVRIRGSLLGERYKIANVLTPVYPGAEATEGEETQANARLIAAAPELYSALQEIIDTEWIGGKGGFVKARAALAKARGES